MIAPSFRSWRSRSTLAGGLFFILTLFYYITSSGRPVSSFRITDDTTAAIAEQVFQTKAASQRPLSEILQDLYQDVKLPITAEKYYDEYEKRPFFAPAFPTREKPLGPRICIIDIDNRPLNSTNELLSPTPPPWSSLSTTSAGMLGHYLYALTHGYTYRFIRTSSTLDRAPYWSKIPALSRILHNHDIVISIDADAQFHHHEIPFEWLLNRWNVRAGTDALLMATDPPDRENYDEKGRQNVNAGFIVAQNLPETHKILSAWYACPDEPTPPYTGCAKFAIPWPAEQGAFANYVRYEYPEHIRELDCDDANGSRKFKTKLVGKHHTFKHSCQGRFVEHHTLTKEWTKHTVLRGAAKMLRFQQEKMGYVVKGWTADELDQRTGALATRLMEVVYEEFLRERGTLVVDVDDIKEEPRKGMQGNIGAKPRGT